jgi:pimeloyl-ACP methyl ester carboxylesterase
MSALALPVGYHPLELRRAFQDSTVYDPIARAGDAGAFFRKPPSGVRIQAERADWLPRFEPKDGVVESLTFDSPFEPFLERLREPYLRHRENGVAHARYWRHHGGPRPTIIAVHGFTADFYLVNEWFFALPWFYLMGCDVLLFTLPFHGSRQTRHSLFSGYGYFAGGPSWMNEAVAHSIFDLRILIDWLAAERGVEQVGVTGISLGGFTSALLAVAEPRLSFSVPNVPVVSMADLILEWQPMATIAKAVMKAGKFDVHDARRLVAVSSPLTYPPAIARERLMIVGGVGDRLAPPKHSRLLWDHWGRCRIHWFPGSHILHLDRGDYLKQMARFMVSVGFMEPS